NSVQRYSISERKMAMENKKQDTPWIAIGLGIGITLGAGMSNIGAGLILGAAIGLAMDTAQKRRNDS
ncbi:MAG: hypothetical protein KF753_25120, partial [Caldilineaceae bacterium]|nr:hypothetical protein [Caldilineaceae bacterium]